MTRLLVLFLSLPLVVAACGSDDDSGGSAGSGGAAGMGGDAGMGGAAGMDDPSGLTGMWSGLYESQSQAGVGFLADLTLVRSDTTVTGTFEFLGNHECFPAGTTVAGEVAEDSFTADLVSGFNIAELEATWMEHRMNGTITATVGPCAPNHGTFEFQRVREDVPPGGAAGGGGAAGAGGAGGAGGDGGAGGGPSDGGVGPAF